MKPKTVEAPTNKHLALANELARLWTVVRDAKNDAQGAKAMGALADKWAAFAESCPGNNAQRIAATLETGITIALSLSGATADSAFWLGHIKRFIGSIKR